MTTEQQPTEGNNEKRSGPAGWNRWQGMGNLGRDPELRYTADGRAVCQFSIACTRKWTTKDGKKKEDTHWQRCVLFGKGAEVFNQYMAKGRRVFVEGRLQTSSWDDEKTGVKRYSTDCVVETFRFLSSGGGDGRPHAADTADQYIPSDPGDDDIPF